MFLSASHVNELFHVITFSFHNKVASIIVHIVEKETEELNLKKLNSNNNKQLAHV